MNDKIKTNQTVKFNFKKLEITKLNTSRTSNILKFKQFNENRKKINKSLPSFSNLTISKSVKHLIKEKEDQINKNVVNIEDQSKKINKDIKKFKLSSDFSIFSPKTNKIPNNVLIEKIELTNAEHSIRKNKRSGSFISSDNMTKTILQHNFASPIKSRSRNSAFITQNEICSFLTQDKILQKLKKNEERIKNFKQTNEKVKKHLLNKQIDKNSLHFNKKQKIIMKGLDLYLKSIQDYKFNTYDHSSYIESGRFIKDEIKNSDSGFYVPGNLINFRDNPKKSAVVYPKFIKFKFKKFVGINNLDRGLKMSKNK